MQAQTKPPTCTVSAPTEFKAGNLVNHLDSWRKLTSDSNILSIVSGYCLEFDEIPCQLRAPRETRFSQMESEHLKVEVDKLLNKGVIKKTTHSPGEFISTVFTRPKKDGSYRLILNLKKLNVYISYHHFKMDTLQCALQLVSPKCWMTVLDLKDAYYTVAINKPHRKYLRFEYQGELYEFNCLPNGLASAPRVFTKLLKPFYSKLRGEGVLIVGYIDDILLLADDYTTLLRNISSSI